MNSPRGNKIKIFYRLILWLVFGGIAAFVLLIVGVLFLDNYQHSAQYSPRNFESELKKNREKWESAQITHYKMTVDFAGYGSFEQMPWTLEVRDDRIISVLNSQGNKIQDDDSAGEFTIAELFADIQVNFQRKAPIIRVTYNPDYGFPENVFINPWREPCCQDYEIKISNFQVLP